MNNRCQYTRTDTFTNFVNPNQNSSFCSLVIYSVSILFGHEEAGTWARMASPAVRRKQIVSKQNASPVLLS
jgi:hypothetical protein